MSFGFAPNFVGRALGATAPNTGRRKVLVCVFQRGAVDGLNMVIPYAEKEYYKARNNIAIQAPGRGDDRALDLDGFFGLHPSLAPLQPWYRDGHLRSFTPSARPMQRAPTSMPRTIWKPARRASRARPTAG